MNKREYSSARIVFLLDVDNTLLDNDGVQADSPFDPEYLPAEIALMESLATKFPDAPQIAGFDTAFTMACRVSQSCCRFRAATRAKA
jgi:acetate kinase